MIYHRLEDASTSLRLPEGMRVDSPEALLAFQKLAFEQKDVARPRVNATPISAQVNHGRWIAVCTDCGNGMLTHKEWKLAACDECGAIYTDVRFPAKAADIETVLLHRPHRMTQNWFPHESVKDLIRENRANGVA